FCRHASKLITNHFADTPREAAKAQRLSCFSPFGHDFLIFLLVWCPINSFLRAWNQNPKPFIWSATVEEIIKKIDRARAKMEQIKPESTQPKGKKMPAVL